jgi:hypothetical protein
MRRYSQVKLIVAIISFSLIGIVAPAHAAQYDSAIKTSAATRYIGSVCKTVRSDIHHRTGFVCVGLALRPNSVGAFVSLMPRSGKFDGASAGRLVLRADGITIEAGVHGIERSGNGFILTTRFTTQFNNLWDGGPLVGVFTLRSGAVNVCMQWRDGDRACTGASWLFSKGVRFRTSLSSPAR